jgi:hypothetical protein
MMRTGERSDVRLVIADVDGTLLTPDKLHHGPMRLQRDRESRGRVFRRAAESIRTHERCAEVDSVDMLRIAAEPAP